MNYYKVQTGLRGFLFLRPYKQFYSHIVKNVVKKYVPDQMCVLGDNIYFQQISYRYLF